MQTKSNTSSKLAIRNDLRRADGPTERLSIIALAAQMTVAAGLPLNAMFDLPAREWFAQVGARLGKAA